MSTGKIRKRSVASSALWVLSVLVATECGIANADPTSSPETLTRSFMAASTSAKSDQAAEYVCLEEGPTTIFAADLNWEKDNYEIQDENGDVARVHIRGQFKVTDQEWKQVLDNFVSIFETNGLAWPDDVPRPAQWSNFSGTLLFGVDFDQFTVRKEYGQWCAGRESVYELYRYLVEVSYTAAEGLNGAP